MANKVLSIEIGYSLTKICEVDFKVKNPKVYNCFSIQTPANTINDGEVVANPQLVQLITDGLLQRHIRTKQVVFTIASTKIASREVPIPPVTKVARIGEIVNTNAKDYFPVDLNDYELSYINMGHVIDEKGEEKLKINVLAAPKNIIAGYKVLAEKCGLTIVAMEYAGNSIYQVVKNVCKPDEVTMVVKVDERSSIVTVLNGENIIMQRSLAYGIDEAVGAMIDSKAYGDLSYETALAEIRRKTCIRKSLSASTIIIEDDDTVEDESVQIKKAKDNITASLSQLISSIERVSDFYNSRNLEHPIKKIYLTGLGGDFSGLGKLMTNEIGTKVTVLNTVEGFSLDKSQREVSFGEYIACLGACVAPLGFGVSADKNGKEAKVVDDGKGGNVQSACIAVFAIFLAIAIALVLYTGVSYALTLYTHNQYVDELNGLQEVKVTYNQYEQITNLSAQVDALYAQTENHNEELVSFIEELEDKMPREISTLSMTATTTDVMLQIEVSSKEAMALVIQQLREFDTISVVNATGASDEIDDYGFETVSFSVQATYVDLAAANAEPVVE